MDPAGKSRGTLVSDWLIGGPWLEPPQEGNGHGSGDESCDYGDDGDDGVRDYDDGAVQKGPNNVSRMTCGMVCGDDGCYVYDDGGGDGLGPIHQRLAPSAPQPKSMLSQSKKH